MIDGDNPDDSRAEDAHGESADPAADLKAEIVKLRGEVTARLDALDEKTAANKENVTAALVGLVAVVATAIVVWVISVADKPDPSDNRIVDYEGSELLAKGPHCYKERAEMLANRQRALGEVDRLTWQRDNPIPPRNDGPMYAVPLPTALPSVSQIPADPSKRREDEKGSDPELCFAVHYGYD
ncbi:Uncharacterised protein [Mycobacteroides abscessus subsp. bolletii]|uniref:hypothetical protein n=1 Tax=Mycobacteroides abscessus TaxID=36809 RepID=UPI0009A5E04B|nr:hypothetical protein [Mycobacteroides abscessus]SLI56796.1 Uncharacterised protein [Mycobacteroides abscessus subsp. bolletii]